VRLTAGLPGTGAYYTTQHRPHGAHRAHHANPNVVHCYYAQQPDLLQIATALAGTGWRVTSIRQEAVPRSFLGRIFLPRRTRWVATFRR